MLDETGRFEFTDEILGLMDRLWCRYQEVAGCPTSQAERLAGLLYIVTALRQDVEGLWAQLAASPELAGIDVAELAAEELGTLTSERVAHLKAALQERGWL